MHLQRVSKYICAHAFYNSYCFIVVRGRVSSLLQLFGTIHDLYFDGPIGVSVLMRCNIVTFGLVSGYFICYGTSTIGSSLSWRIPFVVQSIAAALLAIGLAHPTFVPYSPRWLLQQKRQEEAFHVMDSFDRGSSSEKEKEELLARSLQNPETDPQHQATVAESFRDPKSRWRTIFGMFVRRRPASRIYCALIPTSFLSCSGCSNCLGLMGCFSA